MLMGGGGGVQAILSQQVQGLLLYLNGAHDSVWVPVHLETLLGDNRIGQRKSEMDEHQG